MKSISLIAICEVSVVVFFVGCRKSTGDLRVERFTEEVKTILQDVCKGNGDPQEQGKKLMRSIIGVSDGATQKRKHKVLLDAVANVTFSGEMSIEREHEYFRLHDFLKGVSHILMEHGNGWGKMLELWFAEMECHQKESILCDKESKRLMRLSRQTADFETSIRIARKADEIQHCAQYSATYHELDMSLIVLWDDSVAARYCATLPWWEKMMVVWRIKKAIGRYPDWYLEERTKRSAK